MKKWRLLSVMGGGGGGGRSVVESLETPPQLGQGEAREGQKETFLSLPLTLRMKLLVVMQTALGPVYSRKVLRKAPDPPSRIYMENLLSSA